MDIPKFALLFNTFSEHVLEISEVSSTVYSGFFLEFGCFVFEFCEL